VDEAGLLQPAEAALYARVQALESEVGPLVESRSYTKALVLLAGLRAVVDRFFDEVLVMDEDPAIRANRLALLGRLRALFIAIADVSRLGAASA
jgi:glycyl-tRNA synthetase beta chain